MSGLDFQVVDVKFTQGLDTKTEKKLVIPGKWNQLNNVSLATDGTPRRRDGMVPIVASATGNGVATLGKELLAINGPTVSTLSTAESLMVAKTGSLGYVGVTKTEIKRSSGMQSSFDCASGNGYTAYVWINAEFDSASAFAQVIPTGVYFTLIDETTGAQIFSNVQLRATAAPICPRVVFSGNAFFFLYVDQITSSMYCRVVETTFAPLSIGAEVALITSASLPVFQNFDAIDFGRNTTGSNAVMVSYWWADTTTSLRTIRVTQSAGVPVVSTGPTNLMTRVQFTDLSALSICCVAFSATRAGTFAVSRGGTLAGIAGAVISDTWAVTTSATQLDSAVPAAFGVTAQSHITGALQGSNVYIYADQQAQVSNINTGVFQVRTFGCSSTLGIVSGPSNFTGSAAFAGLVAGFPAGPQGPWICGKAFTSGQSVYLPCCIIERYSAPPASSPTQNEQNSFLLFEATGTGHATAVVVARALYGTFGFSITTTGALASNPPATVSTPCSVPSISTGVFAMACAEQSILSLDNGLNISSSGVCRLTVAPNTTVAPIKLELGQEAFFAGGELGVYDGGSIVEHGFPISPEGISAVRNAGAGDVTVGVHQVVAIYEWVDSQGRRHQSAPSQPVSFTSVGADTVVVVVPTLLVSQKTGVQIVLYMTQAGGLTFNRVISIASPVPNITTAESVSITLGVAPHLVADAIIIKNEILYNQPDQADVGTLPNLSPGPCSAIGLHQNRIFCDLTDQPNAFAFSQELVPGVGLQFNPSLGGLVPESGGGIVGFASMDEKLIIFCVRKPFVLYGSGPDSAGLSSQYGSPIEIPSDVGCVEARSILKMPMGVMFKSAKGWYRIGRDLVCRYIGEGVEAFNANPVSSAVLMSDRQECRFASSSGTHLIYSYDLRDGDNDMAGQWSTSTMQQHDYLIADAIYWETGGYYAHISLTDGLNKDTPGVFIDAPGAIAAKSIITTMRTSFLHPGALESYQRLRRLYLTGTAPNTVVAPTSTLNIAVDYDDVYGGVAPGSYNFSTAFGSIAFGVGMPIDIRTKLRRQKCKSVAFTFTDTPTTSVPAGVNFQAMALEIGMKKGVSKLPAAQSIG